MTLKFCLRLAVAAFAAVLGASIATPAQAQTPAAPPAPAPSPEIPAWISKVTLGGDLRIRLQHTNDIPAAIVDDAALIRARLATLFNVNDKLTVNFRLASANASNTVTSSHQTLGEPATNGYRKKAFWLDIASMDYKPIPGLVLTGGKAVNPFFSGGKNELVMDSDVNPEGFNVKYSTELGTLKPFAAVAYNIISDTGATTKTPDITNAGAQIGTGFKSDAFGATVAAGYYVYNEVKGRAPFGAQTTSSTATNFKGNTFTGTGTNAVYAAEFKLTNVEAEATVDVMGLPLTAYGSFIQNSEVSTENRGVLGGLRLGKLAGAGTWALDYNYRDLGANAIIANFTDGDFGDQTNVYGHRVVASLVSAPGMTISAYGIFAQRTNTTGVTSPWERYSLEFLATF